MWSTFSKHENSWVAKIVFRIQILLIFGGHCNGHFWDIRLQIYRLQWNPVNTDINGTCHSVRVNRESVLSGLILEKIYELLFRRDKRNRPLYPGVHIKQVKIGRGSTVPNFNMLFQLVQTKVFKSELFLCLPKVDHVIN